MIIESVAAASAALTTINTLIQKVNETGQGIHQVMGMVSDFGEALDTFEVERKNSTFKPLSQNDLLRIVQLRRQYERHWQSVNDLLLVADPKLLDDFKSAKADQENRRKQHLAMLARRKKEREKLMHQVLVGGVTLFIGAIISVLIVAVVIKTFS
jgi:hypothetical protein